MSALQTYSVRAIVEFAVDAPSREEAEEFAAVALGDACAWLSREGCDPGEGFDEGTHVSSGPDGFRVTT